MPINTVVNTTACILFALFILSAFALVYGAILLAGLLSYDR